MNNLKDPNSKEFQEEIKRKNTEVKLAMLKLIESPEFVHLENELREGIEYFRDMMETAKSWDQVVYLKGVIATYKDLLTTRDETTLT